MFSLFVLGGIGALLFLLRSILLDQFIGMVITSSLIGIWLIVITIRNLLNFNMLVFIVISIFLWVLTIIMYRILAKLATDTKEKAIYFVKLRFTRLTLALNVAFFFDIFIVLVYAAVTGLSGVFGWPLTLYVQYFVYFAVLIHMTIVFIGITNWEGFFKLYCCICIKLISKKSKLDKNE
jgi:hypothetical protein